MKVLVTAETARTRERTGVQQYAFELVRALAQRPDVDTSILVTDAGLVDDLPPNVRVITNHSALTAGLVPWHSLPQRQLDAFDVIHCSTVLTPSVGRPRSTVVMMIHDLVPLVMPEAHNLRHRLYYRFLLPRVARQADRLIANSNATREDVIRHLHVAAEKIDVIALASRWETLKPEEIHLPKQPFFVVLGTLEPRKNLRRTLAAFALFKKSHPESPHRLLVSGRIGWGEVDVPPSSDVEWIGYVGDERLRELLANAAGLIYPSLYEGFGLPVLEAMSLGCPVICSRRGSLPEVAGDAAIYCEAESVESIAAAITRLAAEEPMRLVIAGLERARTFSWRRCAEETVASYRRALADRRT